MAEEADVAARVLPGGFGGLYERFPGNGTSGTLVVYLEDLGKQDEVAVALPQLLQCGGAYPGWLGSLVSTLDMEFRHGRYTGSEILTYLRAVEPLRDDPDVWGVANDPETNRVWVGLRTGAAVGRLQQALASLSVPLDVVTLEAPPPTTGTEPFAVLTSPVTPDPGLLPLGGFGFWFRVRYTNSQAEPRYPDWCVGGDPDTPIAYFAHTLQQWHGATWRTIFTPTCVAVLLAPREVAPGETATDSVPSAAARRLDARPVWDTPRITGTYRFVGQVYTTLTATPPYIVNLAPLDEQVSAPFRVVSNLPF